MVNDLIFLILLIIPYSKEEYSLLNSIDSLFPTSYTLNNGNILIINQDGINLYNPKLNLTDIIMPFTGEETKITQEEDVNKIAFLQLSDSDGGNIFCLIHDTLYIFSPEVNLKLNFDLKNEISGTHYSLNFHKIENDKIYYTLAFINSEKVFTLIYYELDLLGEENNVKYSTSYKSTNSKGGVHETFESKIACEEMIHHSEGKVLVCFYENRNYDPQEIAITIFNPENFEIISSFNKIYISVPTQINFFKTATTKDKKNALVCYLYSGGNGAFCFFYNIDENNHTEIIKYSGYCKPNTLSFKVYFFQHTNQFMFCCSSGVSNFNYAVFNEDTSLLYQSEYLSIQSCYGFDSMSIVFMSKILKYSIILDAECSLSDIGKKIRLFSIDNFNEIIKSTLSIPILPSLPLNSLPSKHSIINIPLTSIISELNMPSSYPILSSHTNIFNYSYSSFITTQTSLISNKIHSTIISNDFHFSTLSTSINSSIPASSNISNLFATSPTSSLSSPSSIIKCNKYMNYERNKCIDSIPEGYFLFNENLGIIERCHISCKICEKGQDEFSHNCLKCKNDTFSLEGGNCINSIASCPENKPLLNKEVNDCVEFCSYDKILDKKCIIKKVTEKNLDIIIANIKEIILNQIIDEDTNIIVEGNEIKCQILTTKRTKNNYNNNISTIDFNECEKKIKDEFKINYIIIQKMDIIINNKTMVKYDLYNPNKTETKIDLSICKNEKIEVYTPVQMTDEYIKDYYKIGEQGYNILDANDSFYNDICSQFTSDDNTDMILLDRKKNYYNIDVIQCEAGCSYKNIDFAQRQLQCECPIKNEFEISNSEFDRKDFINAFYNVRKYSNLKVVNCFKLIFSKKGQYMNYGSFFLIAIIILFLISQMIFHMNSKELVANLIKKLLKSISLDIIFHVKPNPKKKKAVSKKNNYAIKLLNKSKFIQKNINKYRGKNRNKNKSKSDIIESSIISTKKILSINKTKKNAYNPKKEIANKYSYYNDEELNTLNYDEAIKIDKRGYFQYYISLIYKKQLILFTFISKRDYNLRIIKFSLFLISISLYFTVNSLFFIDENIHKIHEDHGIFNFLYQLPQIIYSSLISMVCNLFINSLALSEKTLLKVKKSNNKNLLISESLNLYICLRKKMYIFFIIGFIMLSFFWYFISGFCAVYKNTQIIYLKNCSISFCLSMIYPFFLSLFPGLFRIPSLKSKRKKYLYIIGNIISLI